MSCDFTIEHYCEILRALRSAGYRFVTFSSFDASLDRQVILRHDVDLSLKRALYLAKIDEAEGVRSVFHVLFTAEVYNPLSKAGRRALQIIRTSGHAFGLHVDPVVFDDKTGAEFHVSLASIFDIAERAMGPLDSYSLHRPAANGRAEDLDPSNLPFRVPAYAYAHRYKEEIIYRSDSRREWRHGCLCRELESFGGRSLQLVVHPVWWLDTTRTRDDLLESLIREYGDAGEDYLESNLSFYTRRRPPCVS